MSYKENIKEIESYYQSRNKEKINVNNKEKPFYYVVPMFPYPSGKIHMGHIRNYAISNVVAQYKKSQGFNVLHPIGFDSFGMPAENAAIKNKVSPKEWTEKNIEQMTGDFKSAGFDFDWSNTLQTHNFEYYKFEQDIFKRAWQEGIIYKKEQYVNYDPVDKTVLSNEQVHNGMGWRTGAKVIRKKIPMYFFNMKAYAHKLNDGLDIISPNWPKRVIEMQRNWINIENGINHIYEFNNDSIVHKTSQFKVFKTEKINNDDIHSVVMGINHEFVKNWDNSEEFKSWFAKASEGGVSQKENFAKKDYFVTPINIEFNERIIPIVVDMNGDDECRFEKVKPTILNNSQSNIEVGKKINEEIAESIGLKDWCISRQRYWGNPIPMINCEDCGDVPSLDYVRLPDNLVPDGNGNVLSKAEDYINCTCPQCGKKAERCSDTMDTFVQSAWYFHRYVSPHAKEMIEFPEIQIDHYIGGVEHATMHLIYTRFFHKMLKDFGIVNTEEPIVKLTTQGMVCKKYEKEDGTIASAKMSKSIGNIVEPKEYIESYGADALQMFMIFAAPPNQNFDFEDAGIVGSYRFLDDVYRYFCEENTSQKNENENNTKLIVDKMEQYIIKEFDGRFNLNTIVPQMMIAFKSMRKTNFENNAIKKEVEEKFIKMLSIFAPQLGLYIKDFYLDNKLNKELTNKI